MHCIVTAGGAPGPEDPLYEYTQGGSKALLDMEGRTMLERVIDALQGSKYVETIVVIGLEDDMGMQFQRPIDQYLPDQGSLVGNVLAGANWLREQYPDMESVLFSTADLPTATAANVDQFVESCQPFDKGIYYIFVSKEEMEARFPGSNRTYTKLQGLEIAGGDMAIAQVAMADENKELWVALTNARKHAWKLARIVGLRVLLKLLFHRLSIADVEDLAAKLIGRPAKIVLNAPAELAMDVDKPGQLEMMRADLRKTQDQ